MVLPEKERAILVGVETSGKGAWPLLDSLEELSSLTGTAGAEVTGTLTQSRDKPDLRYYIGTGKLEELKARAASTNSNLVIFDCELTPSQTRNLEEELGIKVIDRTELILDIFAQRAHSREGKLQVELAQANFTLTHLTGKGVLMSRLGGGIGTRGPGETKLEMDRRVINKKISQLHKELEEVRKSRGIRRQARKSELMPVAAIVGYTNSGKSTLLNALSDASIYADNKLFATLDPTTRRVILPNEQEVLITDTVGFIQKLPHQLVEAFRATLEEVTEADILIHVVDASNPHVEEQIEAVFNVLEELNAITKPIITAFNKTDKVKATQKLQKKFKPSVLISALHKKGLDDLLGLVSKELEKVMVVLNFAVPIYEMNIVHLIHERGKVMKEKYEADKVLLKAKVDEITAKRLEKYIIR